MDVVTDVLKLSVLCFCEGIPSVEKALSGSELPTGVWCSAAFFQAPTAFPSSGFQVHIRQQADNS